MDMTTLSACFEPANFGVKACFCGKPTVEDHDFCFCSPQCARADAMRALGGEGDCHYRNVMRGAFAKQTSGPAMHRHKSEYQLRRASRVSGTSERFHHPSKPTDEKTLPTLAEVTNSILAREERSGGGAVAADAYVRDSRQPCEFWNESVHPIATPPLANIPLSHNGSQQTLKRSVPSKAGLNMRVRKSVLALFRKMSEQTAPLNVEKKLPTVGREPSVTAVPVEDIEEENEEEAAFWRLVNRTEGATRCHQANSSTITRRSGGIRRSASFTGWNKPAENWKEEGVMQVVHQLREAWDEVPDFVPDFDERSDEEY